jgi:flagellar hook-associated protein 1 FlgK
MSLSFALNMTSRSLIATDSKLSVAAQNITNADKAGYTRKTMTNQYVTTNAGTVPIFASVQGTIDRFLTASVVADSSILGMNEIVNQYLDYYNTQIGKTDGSTTLSGYMDQLFSNLQLLGSSPETSANKAAVVMTAGNIADTLRNLSYEIQSQRLSADMKIADTVTAINASVAKIVEYNDEILGAQQGDFAYAEYEDQRLAELEKLAKEIDIQYYFTSNNQVQIYTASGQPLLLSNQYQLSYTPTNSISGATLYPAGFQPILLNGVDITTTMPSGALKGLIDVRDTIFVNEQQKLDEFATALQTTVNAVLNQGASIPPRNNLEGTVAGFALGDPFVGAGTIRVAITDNDGVVQDFQDINLGGLADINDVITAINGIAGLTASLTADGELSIVAANPDHGVSINENGSTVGASNLGFSHYFGFNDMFVGTTAEFITVADYLISDIDYLAVGVLSMDPLLAIGDRGVARGDGSIADATADALTSNVTFAAAGNFSAQSNTLKRYSQAIMADVASQANVAQIEHDTSYLVYSQTKSILANKTGVNVDEETASMVDLQSQYQAAAKIITIIREMFDALFNAVR